MDQVPDMDATGLVALESALKHLEKQKILTILSGVQRQPRLLLRKAKIREHFSGLRIRSDIHDALALATERVQPSLATPVLGPSGKDDLGPSGAPANPVHRA
jgi:hypothetical protein